MPPTIGILPPELLSRIFVSYIDSAHRHGGIFSAPITLGLVCEHWREITLRTHALWTIIQIDDRYRGIGCHIPALNRWVRRSGDLSCHVQITIRRVEEMEEPSTLSNFLHPIANRLRHLDLSLPIRDLQRLPDLFTLGLPRLESLSLSLTEYPDDEDLPQLGLSLATCQRLRALGVSMAFEVCIDVTDITNSLPSSLTHLELEVAEYTTVFHALSQLPNLEFLILNCGPLSERNLQVAQYPSSDNTDSSLTSLTIFFEEVDLRALFRTLRFHYLRYLSLTNLTDAQSILPSIASASPPLRTLRLYHIITSSNELLPCLVKLPTITSLGLAYCNCLDRTLIMALTFIPGAQRQYLPRLEQLSISDKFREGHEATHKEVIDMVESRWCISIGDCSRIVTVYLEQNVVVDPSQIQRVVGMQEEGLDIMMQNISNF